MPDLDQKTFNDIVNLLILHCADPASRKGLAERALYGCSVLDGLDYSGNPRDYVVHLVTTLLTYGDCHKGQPSIVAVLEQVKTQVGITQQEAIDKLITSIRAEELEASRKILSDDELLNQLKEGQLSVLIVKQVAEWVFVHKAWQVLAGDVEKREVSIHFPVPKTSSGIYHTLQSMNATIEEKNDVILLLDIQKLENIFLNYVKPLSEVSTSDKQEACALALDVISATKEFCLNKAMASNDVEEYITLEAFFDFEVAEQLRQIIDRN